MITPPYLAKGSKVAVVSTAKQASPGEVSEGLALLESWGLVAEVGSHAYNVHHFFAGTDAERAEDLQQALDDATIAAIFFTKGAYGTLRIIDKLDFTAFRQHPKWVVGYSDITILHGHIHNLGIETLHAVMLQGIPKSSAASTASMRQALFGERLHYTIPALTENRDSAAAIEGALVGGNLSILYALIGSASDINTDGKILFIEDIDEYLYHFDRMLLALKRSGKLKALKGIVVGGMVDIKESTLPFGLSVPEMILEHTSEYNYPIYFGFPAGHIADNRALIMGRTLRISTVSGNVHFEFAD